MEITVQKKRYLSVRKIRIIIPFYLSKLFTFIVYSARYTYDTCMIQRH